jgi:hypothetical protein
MSSDEFKILLGPIRRPAGPRLAGGDDEFRILMGRGGHRDSFVSEVARATRRAGHTGALGGSPRAGRSTFGRGLPRPRKPHQRGRDPQGDEGQPAGSPLLRRSGAHVPFGAFATRRRTHCGKS